MLPVSLTPPRVTPESSQLGLRVSDSASRDLRPPWLLRWLNGQFFCVTPRWASVLINEWVSLWDHCMVWGLGLHHSCKFLIHLRKPKPAGRSLVPFLQSKALIDSPHFYPDKFYNGSQIEGKCQISLFFNHLAKTVQSPTMEWPWHLSAEPWVFLDFFPIEPPYPGPSHWVGNSPGIFQPAPHPVSFAWVGISRYLSAELHSVSRPGVGISWIFFTHPHHSSIFPAGRGQVTCSTIK